MDATSTVSAVVQIGLRGGIFQYTNALKILGKPSEVLIFDEAFFCYRGSTLIDQDKCSKDDFPNNSPQSATPTKLRDVKLSSSSAVSSLTSSISSITQFSTVTTTTTTTAAVVATSHLSPNSHSKNDSDVSVREK